MEKITLPGSLPGLLRKCSPVICKSAGDGLIQKVRDNFAVFVSDHTHIALRASVELELDLTDATGRQHAIWWLAKQLEESCEILIELIWVCTRPNLWVIQKWNRQFKALKTIEQFSFDEGYCDSVICVSLSDLNSADETRLADGSRWVDAEALRRICLHVAKEKGYI